MVHLMKRTMSSAFLQMRQMICHPYQREDAPQHHSQSETPSPNIHSSRGQLCPISQGMCESINQGLVSPTLFGYAAEAESIDSAFSFKVSHDSYLWLEEQMRQPLVFMADEVGDIMYYHQVMNQPDTWKFTQLLVKEDNGHVDNGG